MELAWLERSPESFQSSDQGMEDLILVNEFQMNSFNWSENSFDCVCVCVLFMDQMCTSCSDNTCHRHLLK